LLPAPVLGSGDNAGVALGDEGFEPRGEDEGFERKGGGRLP